MKQKIRFEAAYDLRNPDPHKNYGIHGVNLSFFLTGKKGTIQFVVYTNWQLPHVTEETKGRRYEPIAGDVHWMERPSPANLGYHSPVRLYKWQTKMRDKCQFTGGTCYYDDSTLNARPVFELLLTGGDRAVWAKLREYYNDTFKSKV